MNISLVDKHEDRLLTLSQNAYPVTNGWNLSRTQTFHFDPWNQLWEIDAHGDFRYIGSLTGWDFYGRPLALRLSACEEDGRCYQAEVSIQFW